jgi:hypothetical protein
VFSVRLKATLVTTPAFSIGRRPSDCLTAPPEADGPVVADARVFPPGLKATLQA